MITSLPPSSKCEVVGEAANGYEALLRSHELKPEVALLDIRMPGMDGLEAARHIAALEQPPAIIFNDGLRRSCPGGVRGAGRGLSAEAHRALAPGKGPGARGASALRRPPVSSRPGSRRSAPR